MNKIYMGVIIVVVIAAIIFWVVQMTKPIAVSVSADYKNTTYLIDGQSVILVNGYSEATTTPGSAAKTVTQYFGNDATGDLNGDGLADTAFILTQNMGGSGTFYYVVVALKTAQGYQGTNGVLLGDRIAPQTTEINSGQLVVNYADRKPGEPFTTQPSVGTSKYLVVQGTNLVETSQPATFLDQKTGISFTYPIQLPTKYITAQDWPPKVATTTGPFTCTNSGTVVTPTGMTKKITVGTREYCMTQQSEGAAGSTYNTYTYSTPAKNVAATLSFTLRMVQCDNYDDPQKTECKNERQAFNPDNLADNILSTLQF
jgi:hypothetical protein